MNTELKQYMQMRCDQRILELDFQEREKIQSSDVNGAIEAIQKKCNLLDLKSVLRNLKAS